MRGATESVTGLVVGQSGLVRWFARMPTRTYSTSNARNEELSQKATHKDLWRHGKHGAIPALSFE